MNQYDISWRRHVEFALAPSHRRRELVKNIGVFLLLVACFAAGGFLDHAESLRQQAAIAERKQALAEKSADDALAYLAACLNGTLRLLSDDRTLAVVCEKPLEIRL